MIRSLLLLFLLLRRSADAVTPSPGCSSPPEDGLGSSLDPGQSEVFKRTMPGTQTRKHTLQLPYNYGSSPSPLLLYFHGWGGNHNECGELCSQIASDYGFVSVSMTGYGPTSGDNSWRHGGSSNIWRPPVISDSTACAADTEGYCEYYEASGCDCSDEGSNCGWTTCWDSVAKVLSVLDEVQDSLCIDLDQVWAMGCSNGGMFTFELARDNRSAPRLKGIVPIVGQPHHGYSEGPLFDNTKLFGMWGRDDDVVPPFSNTDDPYKSVDLDGWWYTTTDKVMSDWTTKKGCSGSGQDEFTGYDFGISNYPANLTCTQGCSESEDGPIVSCIFEGGHDCFHDFMWEPIFNYMLYDPSLAPSNTPTHAPSFCSTNDPSFEAKGNPKRTCDWIAKKPTKRCLIDSGAALGCPATCNPDCIGCNDDPDYFEDGKPKRTCAWVALRPDDRCEKEENADACPSTCNPICATKCTDNADFLQGGKANRPCTWIRKKPDKRCPLIDNGAFFGCPATCNPDCAI